MLVHSENRAIMVVIRPESTEINYDTGGDDGGIIAMLQLSPPVITAAGSSQLTPLELIW
jgi:hypothetical protein